MIVKKYFNRLSRSIFFFMILTTVLLITIGCSSGDDPTSPPTTTSTTPPPPPVAADQTLDRSLTSQYNSESYPLKIFLPAIFATDKNLPVIYLTDGLDLFEILKQKSKEIGLQAIIVAIGDKEGADRQRDFFPSFCGGRTDDSFENFYNLITQQLVPFVDDNYENNHSSRSLIGVGYGGVFAVTALLLENPEALIFHGSIAVVPGFNCDIDNFTVVINEMDDRMDSANSNESFKLHHTTTSEFGPGEFNDYMEDKDMVLPWLEFDFLHLENEDDESAIGPAFVAGLKYIYEIN